MTDSGVYVRAYSMVYAMGDGGNCRQFGLGENIINEGRVFSIWTLVACNGHLTAYGLSTSAIVILNCRIESKCLR